MHDVGDSPAVTLRVRDPLTRELADADALPSAVLVAPGGAASVLAVAHPSAGVYRVTAPLVIEGEHVLTWTVTQGGATQVEQTLLLAAAPGTDSWELPAWAPTLEDVADHIPTRTRPVGEYVQSNDMAGTFTADTTPDDAQVTRLIRRACAWVAASIGTPVDARAHQLASTAAALRAAYWVELAYPERDADVAVYDRLREEALSTLTAAVATNAQFGASNPDPVIPDDLVTYSFPASVPWADRYIY